VENSAQKNLMHFVTVMASRGNLLSVTPQEHNRVVERKNRTVKGMTRSMLKGKELPNYF
jgi:cell division protein YceG involved in septum cleavage